GLPWLFVCPSVPVAPAPAFSSTLQILTTPCLPTDQPPQELPPEVPFCPQFPAQRNCPASRYPTHTAVPGFFRRTASPRFVRLHVVRRILSGYNNAWSPHPILSFPGAHAISPGQ